MPACPPPPYMSTLITTAHPDMLHYIVVAAMLDPGVDLRDVKVAASHADPRTTMICLAQSRAVRAGPGGSLQRPGCRAPCRLLADDAKVKLSLAAAC
jgi:hypothetical protein